jgi:hypothetical protein
MNTLTKFLLAALDPVLRYGVYIPPIRGECYGRTHDWRRCRAGTVHIETLRYYERRRLVAQCLGNGPLTDCSILASLETKGEDTP